MLAEIIDALLGGYKRRFTECSAERVILVEEASRLRGESDARGEEIIRLQALADGYISMVERSESEAETLKVRLASAVEIPVLGDLSGATKVHPFDMTQEQWLHVTPVVIGDTEYYAWDEEKWVEILSIMHPVVKKAIVRSKPSVADCENWTLTMCDMVSLAFIRAGLDRQGAFMKLISAPHSYCGFMLPDYRIRVYEPITGEIVGWLGETGNGDWGVDTYRTQQAFLLA